MVPDPHTDPDTEAIGQAIRAAAAAVPAPPTLRAAVAEQRLGAGGGARRRGRRRLRAPVLAGALAALAAAIVVAVAGLPGGTAAGPSVDDAAAVALARPTEPAPQPDGANETAVRASVGGVSFPNYAWAWKSWHTAGARADRLDGRPTRTVVYRGPTGDVGYTIVDGKPLPVPAGARHVAANGVDLAVYERYGATIVTWRRGGHTCVLAGRGTSVGQLVRFATWT